MYLVGLEDCRETQAAIATVASRDVVCEVCSRRFSRECDRKRHKCAAERQKPVSEQRGAAQCLQCLKWFRSRGGLALHRCVPESLEGCRETQAAMATVAGRDVVCEVTRGGTSVWLRDRSL